MGYGSWFWKSVVWHSRPLIENIRLPGVCWAKSLQKLAFWHMFLLSASCSSLANAVDLIALLRPLGCQLRDCIWHFWRIVF